jgi:flagellar capping protein FliD
LKCTSLGATTLDLLPAGASPTSLQQQSPSGYAISQTTKTWDSSGAPAAYTLVIGGNSYLMPAGGDNTAATLAAQINALHGNQVQATVVNLGTLAAPDNRIALQAVTAGAMNLDIQQTPGTSLQTPQTAATSRTTSTWDATAAPAGNRTVYSLLVGSTTYSFTPADNSAATVASTIDSLFGSQVQASVIDVGSGSPDLRISLQSKTGGSPALDIQKTTAASLETPKTTGALAQYEINSSGVISTSDTRAITVANGVTLNLLTTQGPADNPVDITVTRSTAALNTALSSFTDAYNAVVDEVAKQRGQSAGPLQGQSIVSSLSQALTDIATYNSSNGQINGLASLGLDLSKGQIDGHITYNAFGLLAADLSSSSGVASFFGSATGGGFLQAATNALNNLEAPATGLIKMAESNTQTQITNIGATITDKQNKVNALQLQLQNQMAASDALIASMEQKYSFLSSMFQAQQAASLTMR